MVKAKLVHHDVRSEGSKFLNFWQNLEEFDKVEMDFGTVSESGLEILEEKVESLPRGWVHVGRPGVGVIGDDDLHPFPLCGKTLGLFQQNCCLSWKKETIYFLRIS